MFCNWCQTEVYGVKKHTEKATALSTLPNTTWPEDWGAQVQESFSANNVPLLRLARSMVAHLSRTINRYPNHSSSPVMAMVTPCKSPNKGGNHNKYLIMHHFSVLKHMRNGSSLERKINLLEIENQTTAIEIRSQCSILPAKVTPWSSGPWVAFPI